MNTEKLNVCQQDKWYIKTQHYNKFVQAAIYDKEQRKTINDLISKGYLPHHTSVGVGKLDRAQWRIEDYKGKFGEGVKMITYSPKSTNFNHLTYFLQS